MKYLITYLILTFSVYSAWSQTFSRLIDIDNKQYNYINDFEIKDDSIYILLRHCFGVNYNCNTLIKTDLSGNIGIEINLDTFSSISVGNLIDVKKDDVLIAGDWILEGNNITPCLLKMDKSLNIENQYIFNPKEGEISSINGLLLGDENNYIYGNVKDLTTYRYYSRIINVDTNFNIVSDNRYSRQLLKNDCKDLQFTSQGDLIYINEFYERVGYGEFGLQINKLDPNCVKTDSLEIKNDDGKLPNILSSKYRRHIFYNRRSFR
ncbi:MAG: hypothetical protein R2771_03070 [Saprospiraceae bacterium]